MAGADLRLVRVCVGVGERRFRIHGPRDVENDDAVDGEAVGPVLCRDSQASIGAGCVAFESNVLAWTQVSGEVDAHAHD